MLNRSDVPLERVFHALADPTRLLLLERLTRGPRSVSDLAEPLEMTLPAVMQHLRILEDTGLVRSEKVGRIRTCHLERAGLRPVERWISERRAVWERRLDRLGAVVAETAPPSADPPAAEADNSRGSPPPPDPEDGP